MKQTQNKFNFAESMTLKNTKEYQIVKWNYHKKQFQNTKIYITIIQDNQLVYSFDGVILRKQLIQDEPQNLNILTNIEQIKRLKWLGEYGMDKRKQGKWIAIWNGEVLSDIGGYFENGLRKGLWKELFKNYCSQAKVFESGEYQNDKRIGIWIYIYDNNKIGGGQYNEEGQKNGKWIELSDDFNCNSQLTYHGEYRNGQKVGKWDIWYQNQQIGKNEQMQSFIQKENIIVVVDSMMKVMKSKKLEDGLRLVISSMTHLKLLIRVNIKRVEKLVDGIFISVIKEQINRCIIILFIIKNIFYSGGGEYDERDEGIKTGKWIEMSEGFYESQQVMFIGDYKNGNKVDKWDIYFNNKGQNEKIGGGQYDEGGEGTKIGRWIEISDDFDDSSQVTYNGEYKKGRKIGRWDIHFKITGRNEQMQNYTQILFKNLLDVDNKITKEAIEQRLREKQFQIKIVKKLKNRTSQIQKQEMSRCGSYDERGEELKIGKWVELSDSNSQITQIGEYKKGQKVGRWDIYFNNGVNNRIGGGLYEDGEYGLKIGKWIELSEINTQLTYIGEYKKGQKVGRWDTYFNYFGNKQIGGGLYDEEGEGIKIGRWIEVNDEFFDSSQVTLHGEYKNGQKVGRWDIYFNYGVNKKMQNNNQLYNCFSGGGSYDQVSVGIKIGKWIEIKDNFKWALQTTLNGEYENGKKIGTWIEMQGNIKSKEIIFEH
ncbi:unnamed protein product [Paramecium primaurelia]|uniref:Uncharacterized protein n=1 Tax=Paramecium primaurelia TaxID=5886 RepID=A0A8S1Q821_PARPR|nr:unnamed protein product [Paramecium primaurelia]